VDLLLDQIRVDAGTPMAVAAFFKRRVHHHAEPAIVPRMRRFRTTLPGVEATAGDA
jgi:hypothetical protein